jgi:nucleoside phosphorylase
MAKNIYLDFLNKASADLYGLSRGDEQYHIGCLTQAINVAAFLCSEYCLLPPGFLAECDRAQRAMVRKMHYCNEGVIRFSMRENSIADYFLKKKGEYKEHEEEYGGLFDPKVEAFIARQKVTVVTRELVIGDKLVELWQGGPDNDAYFRQKLNKIQLATPSIEQIRTFAAKIRGENKAVTWPAMRREMSGLTLPPSTADLQHVVQNFYFRQYVESQNLAIVTGLPFAKHHNFGLCQGDFSHDYDVLRHALRVVGCWEIVLAMAPISMILLKAEPGFYSFRDAVVAVGAQAASRSAACMMLSGMTPALRKYNNRDTALAPILSRKKRSSGVELTRPETQMLAELMLAAATGVALFVTTAPRPTQTVAEVAQRQICKVIAMQPEPVGPQRDPVPVAIFCALEEEREYLIERWGLLPHGTTIYWRGPVEGVDCLLYTADQMGRVPAALATMRLLSSFAPQNIVVAGIAGGFKSEDVDLGHLLIPSHIADLAARKIRQDKTGARPEFRPTPFDANQKIVRYLNGAQFKKEEWEQAARKAGEWPKGRVPALHIGCTIASTDEVVSSDKWIESLLAAWPKLKGIEMEAGGVCAAAREMGDVPVTVIRGVSDLADPVKKDNEWRRRAMKTLATLLEVLLREKVIP